MPAWTWLTPALSFGLLVVAGVAGVGTVLAVLCGIGLIGAVIAAVHHAEVIAHRLGEPFGTLVLAVAVTVIEASLILSLMLAGGDEMAVLASRHDLRGGDDHLQRRRRPLHSGRRSRAPRTILSRRRNRRGARGADRDVDAHARAPGIHDDHSGGHLQHHATRDSSR